MANTRLYTRSFAGGEVSPEMFGRIDDSRYQTGAKTMRNFVVKPQGAARSRPGFEYVANTKFASKPTRLIPFVFNNDQAYVLEFGEQYIRLHFDGAPVTLTSITAFTPSVTVTFNVSTDVVNWASHNLVTDDQVVFTGGTLPTGIVAGQVYYVANPVPGSFQIKEDPTESVLLFSGSPTGTTTGKRRYSQGDVVSYSGTNYYCIGQNDSVTPPSLQWYALSGSILEIPTQYDDLEVMDLHYVQSGDILTVVHQNHWPKELRRYSASKWSFVSIEFGNDIPAPDTLYSKPTTGKKIHIESIGTNGASPDGFTVKETLTLSVNDTVYFYGGPVKGGNDWLGTAGAVVNYPLANGLYKVRTANGVSLSLSQLDGSPVNVSNAASIVGGLQRPTDELERYDAYVLPCGIEYDIAVNYRIYPVSDKGVESRNYATVSIDNNLYASGAANALVCEPVVGAANYNVYKKSVGTYGFIGSMLGVENSEYVSWNSYSAVQIGTSTYAYIKINHPAHGLIDNQAIYTYGTINSTTTNHLFFVYVIDADNFYLKLEPNSNPTLFYNAGSSFSFVDSRYRVLPSFIDDNIAPDIGLSPPLVEDTEPFTSANNYPSAVTYFEQRRMFAGTESEPQTFWATRSNSETDFSYHIPVQADDRIKIKVSARQASQIRHLVPLNNLLALTSQAEWRITSIDSDALTPSTVSVRPQSYVGANNVQPQIVNNSLLYCASRGGHVREVGYNWQQQSYATGDVSVRSAHLFDNYELTDMALSKAPQPVVWFTSTSGNLLGFTYIPEEQVGAWHWHDTDGEFLSVCAIPEGEEDRLYAVIRRGASQFVERMDAFELTDIKSYVGLDCSLSFDGTEPNNSHHVHISGGTNWTPNETLTLTMSNNHFAYPATTDVGDQIVVYDASGNEYRLTILATSSHTVATAKPNKTIPSALRTVAIYGWAWARNSFSGLGHLNGFTVRAFADGVALEPQVVSGGAISIANPAVHIVVGLPYTCDLETLPVAMQIDGFGQGRTKNINKAWLKVYQTAGMEIGPDADNLVPASPYETTPELKTSEIQVLMTPAWQDSGTVFVRQSDPVPTTILGMTTEVSIGG